MVSIILSVKNTWFLCFFSYFYVSKRMILSSVVVCRSPDIAKVRTKMLYASSKDRFKRELDGIQVELQATDPSEMSWDTLKARAL